MPAPARVVAAVLGLILIPLGLVILFASGPLSSNAGIGGIVSAGIGVDLLHGAIRGRWPVVVLLWLVP
jgi:hypothetical protein